MPLNHSRLRMLAPVLLGSCLLALSFASAAAAAKTKSVPASIRVVDGKGRTLAEQTQYSGSRLSVKTDRKASCFGPDTGGSGAKAEIPGGTALDLLGQAGATDRDVKPLSITDAFDFGLGLCGIGKAISPDTGFWSLKTGHTASQLGGDATEVGKNDEILWYLVKDFNDPPPDELVLKTKKVKKGTVHVRVLAYGDDGRKSPAAGAEISGFDGVTDAEGKITLSPEGPDVADLTATLDGAIPSNEVSVCTVKASKCPAGYAGIIAGTRGDDKLKVGTTSATIKCGGGKDSVIIGSKSNAKLKGCEKVKEVK